MLKSNELRIGNLILEDGKVVEVERIDSEGRINQVIIEGESFNSGKIEPITLTEESLKRLGFINNELGVFELREQTTGGYLVDGLSLHGFDVNIRYVHQLQNLYFALTQTELVYGDV